jgi:glycine cleavage system H lipoate-binding protein
MDGAVKVGIDDFLQHVTGKITRAELRKTGDKIRKGEHLLTLIQKGKQLNIYSPVSGTIKEKNRSLSEEPSLINTSPYKEGWVYIIEPKNWPVEIQFLSMAEKFKTELKKEFQRLKDFLVSALKVYEPEYAMILQDGGALKDNILGEFGPEVWDDFQTKFIDTAMH